MFCLSIEILNFGRNFCHAVEISTYFIFLKNSHFCDFFQFSGRNFWSWQKFLAEISTYPNIPWMGPEHTGMIDPTHLILEFLGIFKSDEILQNFRKRTPKFQKCPHGRRNFCHPKNLGGQKFR